MDGKQVLKLFATGVAGMFTGGATFINVVESPARMALVDTASCRTQWAGSYNRAKWYMGSMVGLAAASGCLVYYLDEDSESRMLWLIGSGTIICIWPWTLLAMKPDINKLLKDDIQETAGETWVRDHIARWNRLHAVRTALGASAFGLFLFSMLKK